MITIPTVHLPDIVQKLAARNVVHFTVHGHLASTQGWQIQVLPHQEHLLKAAEAELEEDLFILEQAHYHHPFLEV